MIVSNVLISQEVLSRRANSVYIGLTQRCVLARFYGEEKNVPSVELASGRVGVSRTFAAAVVSDVRPCHPTKNRHTLTVRHTCQSTRHEFETAVPGLRRLVHLPDVVDVEEAAGHRDNEGVVDQVHEVYAFGYVVR